MARSKIGYHAGTGEGMTGIMDKFVLPVNAAGIPVSIKSINNTGIVKQVVESGLKNGVTNRVVLRFVGGFPDNPNYDAQSPEAEMDQYYASYIYPRLQAASADLGKIKAHFYVELLNEADKNRWNIVCRWAKRGVELLLADGYKAVVLGVNAGEPEPETWLIPEAKALINLCNTNRGRAAISLHEGFTHHDIHTTHVLDLYPYTIGRVEWLFDACDSMNIAYPDVFISELAWAHNDMPEINKAMGDVADYAELYNNYPEVLGAFLWNLNAGWSNLGIKLRETFPLLAEYTIDTMLPDIISPPNPEPGCPPLPYKVVYNLYPQDVTKQEYQEVSDFAYTNRQSMTGSADDVAGMVSRGTSGSKAIVWQADRWTGGNIEDWLNARGVSLVEHKIFSNAPQPEFLWQLPVRAPANESSSDFWPGYWYKTIGFNQFYTNPGSGKDAYHTGVDLNKDPSDYGLEFFAPANGVVIYSRLASVWGKVLVIRHDDPDGTVWTRYAHMKDVYVGEGSVVKVGQAIGTVGDGEGLFGAHLHHDVSTNGALAINALDWPGTNSQQVQENYVNPEDFYRLKGAEVYSLPPTTGGSGTYTGVPVSYRSYLHGPGDDWRWNDASFRGMMGDLGMPVKYLSNGINADFAVAPSSEVQLVRLFWKPDKYKTPEQAWNEDIRDGAIRFYNKGYRHFEVHNEPNLPSEGLGVVWNNGADLGAWLVQFIAVAKAQMPDAKFWFPGFSPGVPWTNQFAISRPAWEASKGSFYGACIHAYTGIADNADAAANEIVHQVVEAQKYMFLTHPLIVSEASVNRAASPEYKAEVYMKVDAILKNYKGIKGVVWFVSHWQGNPEHQENWYGTTLPQLYSPS